MCILVFYTDRISVSRLKGMETLRDGGIGLPQVLVFGMYFPFEGNGNALPGLCCFWVLFEFGMLSRLKGMETGAEGFFS